MMPPAKKTFKKAFSHGTITGKSRKDHKQFTLFHGGVFGNFHHSQFEIREIGFNCMEQYFHYMKAGKC